MFGNVPDDDREFAIILVVTFQKIKVISTGFIAINAFAGNIQAFYCRIVSGQQILLDFARQIQGAPHLVAFFQAYGHLIKMLREGSELVVVVHRNRDGQVAVAQFCHGILHAADGANDGAGKQSR